MFLNYEGIHVDTAVGCVLICFTILCLFLSLTGLETASYHQQHITYLARLLLNSLLSHKYDDALQCLVGLCGACRRTPELFWRVIWPEIPDYQYTSIKLLVWIKNEPKYILILPTIWSYEVKMHVFNPGCVPFYCKFITVTYTCTFATLLASINISSRWLKN